ncbi:MAG: hypothetical protein MR890_09570 [Akkermansia muciniphila]|nr:hypothetical protein [Akkermansia muciniphila]
MSKSLSPTPPAVQRARESRCLILRVFGTPEGQSLLRFLEDRFETRLPVFQGRAGQYDPLDAMRRDSYREVFLYIHHQLELARQEASSSQT